MKSKIAFLHPDLRFWVVIIRLDGPDGTIVLSRELRATSMQEAIASFKADLVEASPKINPDDFKLETAYGPF